MYEDPDSPSRRHFIAMAAMSAAAVSVGGLAIAAPDPAAIHPFRYHATDVQLADLKKRIRATRWPERETVSDDSQGVPLATMQALARHWADEYRWRKVESRLNGYPQFTTEIDGLKIHFLHIRSRHEDAMPLIVTHGWPGSVIEQLKIIGPLTNPTAHGGQAADAFHLVIPSLPGFGFSGKPTVTGWGAEHTAQAWTALMKRLGYTKFAAQGGDLGAVVAQVMAQQAPPELLGIHINFPAAVPPQLFKAALAGEPAPANLGGDELQAFNSLSILFKKRRAYATLMATRPQTLYGFSDSPVALAAYMLDHGDGWGQPAATITSALAGHDVNGVSAGTLTRDDLLDCITHYWLTNTGISAARFYWETHVSYYLASGIRIPVAVSAFPGENYQLPRSWAESAFSNLIYYSRPEKGGHFAAWEQPTLFADELRASLRPLRAKL